MTAHVLYDAWDDARPATLSPAIVQGIIREAIGFDGLLMTDDLGMKALSGDWWDKSEGSILAGCDMLLHCSGDIPEMERIAMAAPVLAGKALRRAERAEAAGARAPKPFHPKEAWDDLGVLLGEFGGV
jgi:beta-N-acetylhexosaminidase